MPNPPIRAEGPPAGPEPKLPIIPPRPLGAKTAPLPWVAEPLLPRPDKVFTAHRSATDDATFAPRPDPKPLNPRPPNELKPPGPALVPELPLLPPMAAQGLAVEGVPPADVKAPGVEAVDANGEPHVPMPMPRPKDGLDRLAAETAAGGEALPHDVCCID